MMVNQTFVKVSLVKRLHPYDNPLRYICEDHFYDPEEVSEITQEEMEGDLFVTAI